MFCKRLVSVLSFLLFGGVCFGQSAPDVLDIVRAVDANERLASSRSVGQQVITTSSGRERTLEMEMFTKDMNDKQLTVYTGPARVQGDKILMLDEGDDIWFYTPKTDRVRHLASHARRQRVQGSDFSYEDFSTGDWEDDFSHTLVDEEEFADRACWRLASIPTESGPSYARLESWVDKERFVTLRVDYYEEDGLLKRLVLEDIRELSGHWVPFRMTMTNLRDGGRTRILIQEMEVDVDVPDRLFTTNNLKRR
jgi:outer membrane lipoprotein-sorting protein